MAVPGLSVARMASTAAGRFFFERRQRRRVLGIMAGSRRHLPEAEPPQFASHRGLIQADAKACVEPSCQVLAPPAHHAVTLRVRAALHGFGERLALRLAELGRLARRLAVDQPRRPADVEGQHPITHRLQAYRAGQRRFRAAAAIIDHGQRQQSPALVGVAAGLRQTA